MCSLPRPWTSKAQHGIPKWDSSANPYEETCKARRPRTPQHTTHQFVAVHLQGEPRTKTRPRIPLSPITASKKDADEELIVLRAIDRREFHLSRLHELIVAGLDGGKQPELDVKHVASLRAQLAFELRRLRMSGVAVVEAIVRWRRRQLDDFEPFVWRSHNYLLKMLLDVFFLGLSSTVTDAVMDPFLLHMFASSSSHAGDSNSAPLRIGNDSPSSAERGHHNGVERVMLHSPLSCSESPSSSSSPDSCNTEKMVTSSSSRSSSPTDSPQSMGFASPNARRMLRRHQKALAAMFSHERCHTRDDLVRMWAAERILETERGYIGDSFAPISPVLQAEDLEMRRKAALLFWGVGEPLELPSLSTPPPALRSPLRTAKSSSGGGLKDLDPAQKPPLELRRCRTPLRQLRGSEPRSQSQSRSR